MDPAAIRPEGASDFAGLDPDTVLTLTEKSLGVRCSNICRPLNSYINRVYEVHREDGDPVIAKFYRPGRWSRVALQDEHDFLRELAADEVPVVAPLAAADGSTLFDWRHITFALFPRRGGRICDEPDEGQWRELGRLVARIHLAGDRRRPRERITLSPDGASRTHLDEILDSGLVAAEHRAAYRKAAEDILARIEPLFQEIDATRIHGDLHRQNLIFRPGEGFHVIDFDDMAWGPPAQDLWMLLPARAVDAPREVDLFFDGYMALRDFDTASIRLIEPLRAMRFLHYTAWCVRQARDGGFQRLEPGWGSPAYWQRETGELLKQRQEIEDVDA